MVARRAHNPKVVGSNPAPATKYKKSPANAGGFCFMRHLLLLGLIERPSEPLGFRRPFLLADVIGS